MSNQIKARKISFETHIKSSDDVLICLPESPEVLTCVNNLKSRLESFNRVELCINPEPEEILHKKDLIILVGNLADNKVVKDLYFRFLVATDLWYPGPGGYEIRTLLDPYGTGSNIIHIGYSDMAGLEEAINIFTEKIDETIEHLSIIKATRLHISKSEEMQIRRMSPPKLIWMNVARDIYKKGYLGYLTGETEYIDAYLDMWRAVVSYPITKDDQKIKDLHLKMSNFIQTFRLLETAGFIKDQELREKITRYIINWPDTDQGLIRIDKPEYTHPKYPRQNHGMIPALGLAFLINYCRTYGYELDGIDEWEKLVEKAYHPYMSGSWKPVCDGTCHGWWLSQPALLEYGLIDKSHRYFKNGGAKKAAEAAMALVSNSGLMPSSGDYNLLRAFPGISLRHAAAYYSDGRFKYVHDMAPHYHSSKYHVYMPRMFDAGLKAIVPNCHTDITVTPMDPLIYNSWETAPELVEEMLHTGPSKPIDKCFDKLTFRTGWSKDDQYLLVDGLGSNSNHTHSYPDALGIIEYYHMGERWIIAENGCKFPEPENNTILTIVRKGEQFLIPSFGELITAEENDVSYYAAMKLSDYSKSDWTREVTLIKGVGLVVVDTVDIKEDGDYVISTHMRTPGKARIEGNSLYSIREHDGVEKRLTIESFCSHEYGVGLRENDFRLSYRNHPGEAAPSVTEEDIVAEWQRRYHTADRVVSSMDSRFEGECKKGDRITFVSLIYAQKSVGAVSSRPMDFNVDNLKYNPSRIMSQYDYDGSLKPLTVPQFEGKIDGPVYSFVELDEFYYIGHGRNNLTCLDCEFKVVWSKEIIREPSYCYWWELNYPTVVALKIIEHEGQVYIIAGCGDLFLRCLDEKGNERWRFQYINGVPGRIELFDIDGDGVPEILVGGEVISNRSQCRVLKLSGDFLYELDVEFWTSRMTAFACMATENERFVAFGANRGRNLHLFRTYKDGDPTPVKMLEKKLGGVITRLEFDEEKRLLTAVSSENFAVNYDFKGKVI